MLENWSAWRRLLLGCHLEYDLLVWSLSRSLHINETLFGSKGRDVIMAEHFPKPLKLLGVLPPISFPWILTMNITRVIHGVGRLRSTNQHRNWHGVGQWRGEHPPSNAAKSSQLCSPNHFLTVWVQHWSFHQPSSFLLAEWRVHNMSGHFKTDKSLFAKPPWTLYAQLPIYRLNATDATPKLYLCFW